MTSISLRLTFCLLAIGFAHSFENVAESQVGQRKRSPFEKDEPIFFKAFLSSDTVYGVRGTIVFSDVQHNIGGAYNNSSGVFTAPVSGLYEFKIRVQRISGANAEIALVNQHRIRASTTSIRDWESYGIGTIMKVKKGDHVFVKVNWSSNNNHVTIRSGYFTQFTGYLIRQL